MPIIEVDHLQKRYGDTVAVADVSLSIEEGEIFAILGPNGAGKTTTVEAIAGLREPDGGQDLGDGLDPVTRPGCAATRCLGIQLQESQQPDKLEVGEALELYASFYEHPADPGPRCSTCWAWPASADARFAKLSGGQKQRLSIALALIGNPRIAILDELTTGLDPQARRDTWELIREIRDRGVTIVLVTHFMEEAERLADRVALIDSGRVVAIDTPAGLTAAARAAARHPFPSLRAAAREACSRASAVCARSRRRPRRRSSSPAPATCSARSSRCSPATGSSPIAARRAGKPRGRIRRSHEPSRRKELKCHSALLTWGRVMSFRSRNRRGALGASCSAPRRSCSSASPSPFSGAWCFPLILTVVDGPRRRSPRQAPRWSEPGRRLRPRGDGDGRHDPGGAGPARDPHRATARRASCDAHVDDTDAAAGAAGRRRRGQLACVVIALVA